MIVPHDWVVIKITFQGSVIHKVFAAWRGGYAGSDSWSLNSGILAVEVIPPMIVFYGNSGSQYFCHKSKYGIRGSYNNGVLHRLLDQDGVEVMPQDTDWLNVDWKGENGAI